MPVNDDLFDQLLVFTYTSNGRIFPVFSMNKFNRKEPQQLRPTDLAIPGSSTI